MLNYAAGVIFPFPIAPPMITIFSIFYLISGYESNKIHKLVNDPVFAQIMRL